MSLQEFFIYFCFNPLLQFYARGPVLSGTLCTTVMKQISLTQTVQLKENKMEEKC
jgi:hypothetical protein